MQNFQSIAAGAKSMTIEQWAYLMRNIGKRLIFFPLDVHKLTCDRNSNYVRVEATHS
jgi:hypothetical protein